MWRTCGPPRASTVQAVSSSGLNLVMTTGAPTSPGKPMLSEQVYVHLRDAIMHGHHTPGEALKPQDLAREQGVSLAVVREALVRLVGEGLADRLPNHGFAVPVFSVPHEWQAAIAPLRPVFAA